MNLYTGYFAMWGGVDPFGLMTGVHDPATNYLGDGGGLGGCGGCGGAAVAGAGIGVTALIDSIVDAIKDLFKSDDYDDVEEEETSDDTSGDCGCEDAEAQPKPRSNPYEGDPGNPSETYDENGEIKQKREYDNDGYPKRDIDYDHDHGQGKPHYHDWSRHEGGGKPTHLDRQPGKPYKF